MQILERPRERQDLL